MPHHCRRFDAIFYTDNNEPFEERILKNYLKPNGSYVSTVPEQLTSDSLGFICETIFAGCVRIRLLAQVRSNPLMCLIISATKQIVHTKTRFPLQYIFGFNMHQWKEGAKLNVAYLQALCDLVDAKQLQPVVGGVYTLNGFERALSQVLDPNSLGSTIITFK